MRTAVRGRRPAEGQILALFAGAVIVIILFTGLVIDGGNVFVQRRDAQNSADLGAMAGTKRLADYYVLPAGAAGKAFTGPTTCTRSSRPGWARTTAGPARIARGPHGTSARGPAWRFVDLGPVSAIDTAPPGAVSGTKALGVTVAVTKTPADVLPGRDRQVHLDRQHGRDRHHREAPGRARPASSCRSA